MRASAWPIGPANTVPVLRCCWAGSMSRAAEMAGEVCEDGPQFAKPYEPQAVVDRIKRLKAARAAGP
jgi:hypothetical protein